MAVYSQDLRDRALSACQRGEPVTVIAERLEVSASWVHKVYRRFKETGEHTVHRMGGYRKPVLEPWKETIEGWIDQQPDLTLAEMTERLNKQGVAVAVSTLWHQLNRWGLTFKKKPARPRTASSRRANRT